MQANCPICSKDAAPTRVAPPPRAPRSRSATPRTPKASSGIRVRRVERAAEDGYENLLVHGLRATADGARFADELAFSEARLAELAADPPGLYAAAASAGDPEEAVWLTFLIAYISPGRGGDPWSEIEAARVPWSTGELPALDGITGGPRTAHDPGRRTATIEAWRHWAQRSGGQVAGLLGDADWEPRRRFARSFERLALPGFGRSARYELLVTLGTLGIVPLEAGTLAVGTDNVDPVAGAAKRVFGIGDAINLERRAAELARETGVPFGALDLALYNFDRPADDRATMGARRTADPARRAAIGRVLGV
jgi:hypothetical protein